MFSAELEDGHTMIDLPTFIPMTLIALKNFDIERDLAQGLARIQETRLKVGMFNSVSCDPDEKNLQNLNPLLETHKLNRLATVWAKCDAHLPLLERLDQERKRFVDNVPEHRQKIIVKSARRLDQKSLRLRDRMNALRTRSVSLSQRSQVFVETVSPSPKHRSRLTLTVL